LRIIVRKKTCVIYLREKNQDLTSKLLFKFCVVYVLTVQTDEWCIHNRLFKANFDGKSK
jgi:hypothetical protein